MVKLNKLISVVIIVIVIIIVYVVLAALHDHNISKVDKSSADVIIIGGGVAGCITARRIHDAFPCKKILILERGKDHSRDKNVYNIANALTAAFVEPYSKVLFGDFPNVAISSATMYGGGSSHNFALAVRGSPNFYNQKWKDQLELSYDDLIPIFCRINKKVGITPLPIKINLSTRIFPALGDAIKQGLIDGVRTLRHGLNVLANTGPLRADEEFSDNVVMAVNKLKKVPIVEDYNDGIGVCVSKSPYLFIDKNTGIRNSVDQAYLPSFIRKRKNMNLAQSSGVEKLIMNRGKCVIIQLESGKIINLKEDGIVVMASGGLCTPFLLKKSNVGNDEVGKNLINHYGCSLIFSTDEDFNFSSGPVCFVPRNKNGNKRDWQTIFSGETLTNPSLLEQVGLTLEDGNFTTMLSWLMDPKARGSVGIGSDEEIEVKFDYFNKQEDIDDNVAMLRWMYDVAKKLRKNYPSLEIIYPPERDLIEDDFDVLLQWCKDGITSTDHYSGTCALGKAVNSEDFKLIGLDNIYITDTSVWPGISDGNTQYPTMVMAEIASSRIIKNLV